MLLSPTLVTLLETLRLDQAPIQKPTLFDIQIAKPRYYYDFSPLGRTVRFLTCSEYYGVVPRVCSQWRNWMSIEGEREYFPYNSPAISYMLCKNKGKDVWIRNLVTRSAPTISALVFPEGMVPKRKFLFDFLESATDLKLLNLRELQWKDFSYPFSMLRGVNFVLESVCLDGSSVDAEGVKAVLRFPRLKRLSIDNCAEIGFDRGDVWKKIGQSSSLQLLSMANLAIGKSTVEKIKDLETPFDKMHAVFGSCSTEEFESFRQDLSIPTLFAKRLDAIVFDAIGASKSLQDVCADKSSISSQGVQALAKIPTLQRVSLKRCKNVTDKECAKLPKTLIVKR